MMAIATDSGSAPVDGTRGARAAHGLRNCRGLYEPCRCESGSHRGEESAIQVGHTTGGRGRGLEIAFEGVSADSRCPEGRDVRLGGRCGCSDVGRGDRSAASPDRTAYVREDAVSSRVRGLEHSTRSARTVSSDRPHDPADRVRRDDLPSPAAPTRTSPPDSPGRKKGAPRRAPLDSGEPEFFTTKPSAALHDLQVVDVPAERAAAAIGARCRSAAGSCPCALRSR